MVLELRRRKIKAAKITQKSGNLFASYDLNGTDVSIFNQFESVPHFSQQSVIKLEIKNSFQTLVLNEFLIC